MKQALIKLLVGRQWIGQIIKYVSAAAAGSLLTWLACAPGWVQWVIDQSGAKLTKEGLALIIALILAEIAQAWVDKINAKGVKEIQATAGEEIDAYAGSHTIGRVKAMDNEIRILREDLAALRENLTTPSIRPPFDIDDDVPPAFPTSLKPPTKP